jgi:hypothetical protein
LLDLHATAVDNAVTPPTNVPDTELPALPSCLSANPVHSCHAANPCTTIADRIAFYHACCFSPALSTWCAAIDAGRFTTWPELTSALVRRYPPPLAATIKGHLDQERANLRSTKEIASTHPVSSFRRFPIQSLSRLARINLRTLPSRHRSSCTTHARHLCRLSTCHRPDLFGCNWSLPGPIQRRQLIPPHRLRLR